MADQAVHNHRSKRSRSPKCALLDRRAPFDYAAVRDLAAPVTPTVPMLATPEVPDLRTYDALLMGATR
jgi:hypothetical protein